MKLTAVHLSNFQCFGEGPTAIDFDEITFLIGPNGSGKTALLQALARLFGFERSLRNIRPSDFHVPQDGAVTSNTGTSALWIEARFEFPELRQSKGKFTTIPSNFAHMRLTTPDGDPELRIRLTAEMDQEGEIDESLSYVIEADENGEPVKLAPLPKHDRSTIQVHYLPARRDPSDHVSYAASSLLGRALRSANWTKEREIVEGLAKSVSEALEGNSAVEEIAEHLTDFWSELHKGTYYADPSVSFECDEMEKLLRHLSIGFSPGHLEDKVPFSRLSDGQKSLLYLSLVLTIQGIGRSVLAKKSNAFDVDKFRPAIFTMIAMEEPENSLSPHYLGRVIKALTAFAGFNDGQSVIATHAPSMLKRVPPEQIRYLRLDEDRRTVVKSITIPDEKHEAHKFVREAVQAFPELYFSRVVILGEGDSEEVVLPRVLQARGLGYDDTFISVVPLGGRHVNHFWRLLHDLGIPHFTLLDLDLGRYRGGWGRVKYALKQLLVFSGKKLKLKAEDLTDFPKWDGQEALLTSKVGRKWIDFLESAGVFFSSPLDLDFAMLQSFSDEYGVDEGEFEDPDKETIVAVLGKKYCNIDQYSEEEQQIFQAYHRRFQLGSKPTAHLAALAEISDSDLVDDTPGFIDRLIDSVEASLEELPE